MFLCIRYGLGSGGKRERAGEVEVEGEKEKEKKMEQNATESSKSRHGKWVKIHIRRLFAGFLIICVAVSKPFHTVRI